MHIDLLDNNYYEARQLSCELGGHTIQYNSKPGLPAWDEITPAMHLLSDCAQPKPSDLIWCINCGPGALPIFISQHLLTGKCFIYDHDYLSLTCTKRSAELNQLDNTIIVPQSFDSLRDFPKADMVLMIISKGRSINRRLLFHAWNGLKPGGRLLIAGSNDLGIQSTIKDGAALFNNTTILGYKKGGRIAKFIKSESLSLLPDWTKEPGISPDTWQTLHINLSNNTEFDLVSLPGVFSYTSLDHGTRLLLSTLNDLTGIFVLDIGCGYGILGMYASVRGAFSVDMVDSNLLAVASSQENINRYGLRNCHAFASDLFSSITKNSYDLILSNPPFHTGNLVNYQIGNALITGAYTHLKNGGHLQIVANRFIRYDEWMLGIFGNVSILTQNPAYHVLSSQKE